MRRAEWSWRRRYRCAPGPALMIRCCLSCMRLLNSSGKKNATGACASACVTARKDGCRQGQSQRYSKRLVKNVHLPFDRLTALSFAEGLRTLCRRTEEYASLLMKARALHLSIFDQPLIRLVLTICTLVRHMVIAILISTLCFTVGIISMQGLMHR